MISNLQKPSHQRTTAKPKANPIGVSPILTELAYVENTDVFTKLKTSLDGLSRAVAEARKVEYGPNAVAIKKKRAWLWRVSKAARNLLVICWLSWPPSRS
jgi:Cation transporter/ATPase, N-terminus